MRAIYSLIFDMITDPLGLPISALWEYIILAVIGAIAFKIAWEVSPGGTWGSEIHWFVRVIAFVALWAVIRGIIEAGCFVVAHWIPITCILGAALIIGGIGVIVLKTRPQTNHS